VPGAPIRDRPLSCEDALSPPAYKPAKSSAHVAGYPTASRRRSSFFNTGRNRFIVFSCAATENSLRLPNAKRLRTDFSRWVVTPIATPTCKSPHRIRRTVFDLLTKNARRLLNETLASNPVGYALLALERSLFRPPLRHGSSQRADSVTADELARRLFQRPIAVRTDVRPWPHCQPKAFAIMRFRTGQHRVSELSQIGILVGRSCGGLQTKFCETVRAAADENTPESREIPCNVLPKRDRSHHRIVFLQTPHTEISTRNRAASPRIASFVSQNLRLGSGESCRSTSQRALDRERPRNCRNFVNPTAVATAGRPVESGSKRKFDRSVR